MAPKRNPKASCSFIKLVAKKKNKIWLQLGHIFDYIAIGEPIMEITTENGCLNGFFMGRFFCYRALVVIVFVFVLQGKLDHEAVSNILFPFPVLEAEIN